MLYTYVVYVCYIFMFYIYIIYFYDIFISFIYIHIYHYLSMCICLLTKALMHDACRIRRRGECTDLFNIVCVWFRILCFRVNPWPLFMFASVDLWVLLVFCESSISIFPGGTLIRKVGEKSFFLGHGLQCSRCSKVRSFPPAMVAPVVIPSHCGRSWDDRPHRCRGKRKGDRAMDDSHKAMMVWDACHLGEPWMGSFSLYCKSSGMNGGIYWIDLIIVPLYYIWFIIYVYIVMIRRLFFMSRGEEKQQPCSSSMNPQSGWWFGTFFPHIGNKNPNWLSYFSEGLKPPTSNDRSLPSGELT